MYKINRFLNNFKLFDFFKRFIKLFYFNSNNDLILKRVKIIENLIKKKQEIYEKAVKDNYDKNLTKTIIDSGLNNTIKELEKENEKLKEKLNTITKEYDEILLEKDRIIISNEEHILNYKNRITILKEKYDRELYNKNFIIDRLENKIKNLEIKLKSIKRFNKSRLRCNEVKDIKERLKNDESPEYISKVYGINISIIKKIKRGIIYKKC